MTAPRARQGEDGERYVLTKLPYARLPHRALTLSKTAYKVLGALQLWVGPRAHCEVTNQDIGHHVGASIPTIQRALVELEEAHLVERKRRNGRRRIVLLYTLAGRETKSGREAAMINALITAPATTDSKKEPAMINASITGDQCNGRPRSMQSSPVSRPLPIRKQEEQQEETTSGSAAGVVVASSSLPQEDDREPPGRRAFLAGLVADLAVTLSETAANKKTPAPGESCRMAPGPVGEPVSEPQNPMVNQ